MKRKLAPIGIVLAVLFIGSAVLASTKFFSSYERGMLIHYKFDGGEGPEASDSSGHNRDGILQGSPTVADGHFDGGLSLDGVNEYVEIPETLEESYSAMTVSIWFKADDLSISNSRVVANSHTDIDFRGFQMTFGSGGGAGTFDVGNGSTEGRADWSQQLLEDTWYHYVGTYDGAYVKAYLNGVEVASSSYAGGEVVLSGYNINIGRNPAYNGDYFAGVVDDFRLYGKALTAEQVEKLYNGQKISKATIKPTYTPSDAGLVTHYTLDTDDIDGTTVEDSSNGANDGTLLHSQSPVSGKISEALNMTGDQYIALARPIADDFSICSWIKTSGSGGGMVHWQSMPILDSEVGGVSNDFGFGISSSGTLIFGNGNGSQDYQIYGSSTVNTNEWTHVCATRDISSGEVILYVNGVVDVSGTGSNTSLSDNSVARIGSGFDGATNWSGFLDDIRIYDRVLLSSEILGLAHINRRATVNASRNSKMTDGLEGLWSFDGPDVEWSSTTEAIVHDESGNDYDGTFLNASQATSTTPGRIGQAFSFDGVDDCIATDDQLFNDPDEFTISGWLYLRNYDNTGFFGQNDSIEFGIDGGDIRGWTPLASVQVSAVSVAPLNKWHHIAFVGGSEGLKIFVDGESVAENPSATGSYGISGSDVFSIGCRVWNGMADTSYFDGKIDDVRAYNRTLTDLEIRSLYLMGK